MRILMDTGISKHQNIGDQAIYELTRQRLEQPGIQVTMIQADSWRILQKIVQCQILYICAGGLFGLNQTLYIYRKFLSVGLARILRKQIIVDSQTLQLSWINQQLFKAVFHGIPISCRDQISLQEGKTISTAAHYKPDPVLGYTPKNFIPGSCSRIVIDSRIFSRSKQIQDRAADLLNDLYTQQQRKVVLIETIDTNEPWKTISDEFGKASVAICVSLHAAEFAVNQQVKTYCLFDNEYYKRKFSELKQKAILINLRKSSDNGKKQ